MHISDLPFQRRKRTCEGLLSAAAPSSWFDNATLYPLQLEEAQGGPDEEAQQALETLQERIDALEVAQKSTPQPDAPGAAASDIEIASNIDRCVTSVCFRMAWPRSRAPIIVSDYHPLAELMAHPLLMSPMHSPLSKTPPHL